MRTKLGMVVICSAAVVTALTLWLARSSKPSDLPAEAVSVHSGRELNPPENERPVGTTVDADLRGPDLDTPSRPPSGAHFAPSARATVPSEVRVVTSAGAPISGALVTWSPLSRAWLERAIHWPDLDWSGLERDRRTFESDTDGRVVIEDLPRTAHAEASVLWITHPGHRATSVSLDFPSSELALPSQVSLEPCAPIVVRVLDVNGEPAQGATIVELVDFSRDDALVEGEMRERAGYVLRAVTQSDANGSARLAAFADKHYVYAELGDLRSEPWLGAAPANVTLELRPTFRAGGRVDLDAAARPSDMRVKCTVFRGYEGTVVERLAVRPDGTWGDVELPLLKCDHYAFSFRGGDLAEEVVTHPPPEVGTRLTVDFKPKSGLSIPVRVVDVDGAPLKDATASVHWNVGGRWQGLSVKTDRDGNAVIRNCVAGQIWVRARADRFIQKTLPELALTSQPTEPFVVQLDRAGRITGRCTRAGKPVADFSVLFWLSGGESRGKEVVSGSADGSFVIEDSPLGDVQLVVTTNDVARGDAQRVTVTAGVASEVAFELSEAISGTGRVIDSATGEPVSGARVQVVILDPMKNLVMELWKAAEPVSSDGSFKLSGLVPGANVVAVTAPGYGKRDVRAIGVAGGVIEFGTIGIHRTGSAEIQLVSNTPIDFTQYRASIDGSVFVPDQSFSADGRLGYEDLDPDSYSLTITFPDGAQRVDDLVVRPGARTGIEIPIRTTPVTVEVVAHGGASNEPYKLHVGFHNARFLAAEQTYVVPDSRRLQIDGMTGEWMMLRLFDANARCVAIDEVALTPSPPALVRLRAREDTLTFRVSDGEKRPVPGVRVVVTTPSNDTGWKEQLETDARGECQMAPIALERVFVLLHHPDRGVELSQLVEVPRDGRGTIELVFAPQHTLRVRLLEHDVAVPNIEVSVQDSQRLVFGLGATFTDRDGIASWGPVGSGNVDLYVLNSKYWWSTRKLHVTGNDAIPIQVRKAGSVDILVKDRDGNPVSGVAIDLRSVELKEWASTWIHEGLMPWPPHGLTSDPDGRIRADGLPSGEYDYRVMTSGNEENVRIEIPVHSTLALEIELP